MNFESSACIRNDIKLELQSISVNLNIPMNTIFKDVIKKTINIDKHVLKKRLILYQPEINMDYYDLFRYRLSENERDMFSSARNRLCISISHLFLIGFILFIKKIINRYKKKGNKDILSHSYTILRSFYLNIALEFLKSIGKDYKTIKKIE